MTSRKKQSNYYPKINYTSKQEKLLIEHLSEKFGIPKEECMFIYKGYFKTIMELLNQDQLFNVRVLKLGVFYKQADAIKNQLVKMTKGFNHKVYKYSINMKTYNLLKDNLEYLYKSNINRTKYEEFKAYEKKTSHTTEQRKKRDEEERRRGHGENSNGLL